MRSKHINAVIEKPKETAACSHHWLIESAVRATSKGVCKLCGAEKVFSNVIDESVPKDEITSLIDSVDLDDTEDDTEDKSEESVGLKVKI